MVVNIQRISKSVLPRSDSAFEEAFNTAVDRIKLDAMEVIHYHYGKSPFWLLDLFHHQALQKGTVLVVGEWEANLPQSVFETEYNFAVIGDKWGTTTSRTVNTQLRYRLVDTVLFVINNVENAATVFNLAAHISSNIEMYEHLSKDQFLPRTDATFLSIANHLIHPPTSFVPLSEHFLVDGRSFTRSGTLMYNHSTNGIASTKGLYALWQ
jgi:hypothetical protein